MAKLLVTGSSGFIGRPLVQRLTIMGHQVVALDSSHGDIAESRTLQPFSGQQIEAVLHLAGRTYVPDSWIDPPAFLRVNVQGTANVLEFCRREGCSLVHVSAYVYGHPERLPIPEDHPVRPSNPYAMSKYEAEVLCQFYADVLHVPVTIVRPFNIFGPGQAAHFLIPSILRQIAGIEIRVQDLAPRRDYLYIDDLVAALTLAVERLIAAPPTHHCAVYNVGYGKSLSVAEIIAIAQRLAGSDLPVVSENAVRTHELIDVVADISLIGKELGWRPQINIEAGLKRMME